MQISRNIVNGPKTNN